MNIFKKMLQVPEWIVKTGLPEDIWNRDKRPLSTVILLAKIYMAQERYSEAHTLVREVLSRDPNYETRAGREARDLALTKLTRYFRKTEIVQMVFWGRRVHFVRNVGQEVTEKPECPYCAQSPLLCRDCVE